MGMMDGWAKKYGESKIAGIDPSASPQQFLGQILNNVVGDKKSEDGDGIRESMSPIDFIAPEAVGVLGGAAKKAGQVTIEAAPRLISNEVGAIGKDISGFQKAIQEAAAKSNVRVVPTFEQAADDALVAPFKNGAKNFFDSSRAKAIARDKIESDRESGIKKLKEMLGLD